MTRDEMPAGTVRLDVCVRCGRELGWGPGQARPDIRVGGSKASSGLKRYCCHDCLQNLGQYWR
jgi:hypothetical protein